MTFRRRQRSAISRDMNGVPWSVSISAGMPTRLLNRNSSWAMALAVALRRGDCFRIPGGIVDYHQDVFVVPGVLWQRPYQIHSDALEGHLDDGQRNQRAGGRCLGRGPLTGRAGLTEPFHIGICSIICCWRMLTSVRCFHSSFMRAGEGRSGRLCRTG